MAGVNIPKRLPLLFIKNTILLPGSTIKLQITTPIGTNIVTSRLLSRNTLANCILGVVTVEDMNSTFRKNINNPESKIIGTAAFVVQVMGEPGPKPLYTLYLCGISRFSLDQLVMEEPYPVGVVTQLDYLPYNQDNVLESKEEKEQVVQKVRELTCTLLTSVISSPWTTLDIEKALQNTVPASLPDVVMSMLTASYEEKKDILKTLNVKERLEKVLLILQNQVERMKQTTISSSPKPNMIVLALPRKTDSHQRAVDNAINLSEAGANEIEELQKKIVKANLPEDVNKIVMRDFYRLKKMGPFSPENEVIRSYLEFVIDLPWSVSSVETIDINKARKDLDSEHYGMDKVKKRVLEYLAVRKLKSSARGPILCFVGPPGVGKTSIGKSIAQTLGRQFQRISLGGVNNQSDIRGHRRTYIGAMPGRIIQAIKNAGVNNPVILLDELDKMSKGYHGDPAAALLEVLDPLQNQNFVDHYLNVPFDLSQVTFIATANQVTTIPAPLLDRTETISVGGYTLEEKVHIAENHLLPKQLRENGLDSNMIIIPVESLEKLISCYTSEAGVRSLERQLGAVCRAIAVRVADGSTTDSPQSFHITLDALEDILGPPTYSEVSVSSRMGLPGVAVGLAWSNQGGSVLVVEASKLPGGIGKLILTGLLGDIMKESAQLALNWTRGVAFQYGLVGAGEDLLSNIDVHIHFPEGAVSKEGPSAGITIATALISLFSDVPLIPSLAMTGELTLRGVVLPVGGVKEKLLAAHRAGIKKIILPKLCIKDMLNVPDSIKEDMQILFVEKMGEVIEAAFNGLVSSTSQSQSSLQSHL